MGFFLEEGKPETYILFTAFGVRTPSASSNGKYRSSDRVPKRFSFSADIFVFLLSTRAGGLGINLTAADTVRQLKEVIISEKTLDG